MTHTLQASPMLQAAELLRVNIDAMQLDDLLDHEQQVLESLAGLNDFINRSGRKSSDELRNAMRLSGKVMHHLAHLRDLIHARMAALAMMQAAQTAASASTVQDGGPFCP